MIATSVTVLVAAVLGVLAVRAINKRRERDGKPRMSPFMSVCMVLLVCGTAFGIYAWARLDSPLWNLTKPLMTIDPIVTLSVATPSIASPSTAMAAPSPFVECDIQEMMSHIETGAPPF